jgi:hypothetical protein
MDTQVSLTPIAADKSAPMNAEGKLNLNQEAESFEQASPLHHCTLHAFALIGANRRAFIGGNRRFHGFAPG